VVRQGPAKPLFPGSIPGAASIFISGCRGGGIGRRDGLKIRWPYRSCGFKSRPRHQPKEKPERVIAPPVFLLIRHKLKVRSVRMTSLDQENRTVGDVESRLHFLVIAAASRGARLFIKKALRQGHSVTALCRAADDQAALGRIKACLADAALADGFMPMEDVQGALHASSRNIVDFETYRSLLDDNPSINRVCCFVGVRGVRQMMRRDDTLYTRTIRALIRGMRESRWVEFFYHGSSGSEGIPGQNKPQLPANFRPQWLLNWGLKIPAAQDCFASEMLLAEAKSSGLKFVVFRPAWLTNAPAKRSYGYCFDTTAMDDGALPLRDAKTTISREDVAEEILRVATLPEPERARWFGHGVYLVDMKANAS
jgi:nucleoside-diphosphate-sugar epimerase